MKSSHTPKLCVKSPLTAQCEALLGSQPLCQLPARNHSQLPCETRTHPIQEGQIFVKHTFAGTTWGGGGPHGI